MSGGCGQCGRNESALQVRRRQSTNIGEEYEQLRANPRECRQLEVPAGRDLVLSEMRGDCMELEVRAEPASDQPFGVKVRRSPGAEESTAILYDPGKRVIRIDLARSSLDKKVVYHRYVQNYGGRNDTPKQNPLVQAQEAPFELPNSEPLTLRIFIDRSILEVFVNNRLCLVQRVFPTRTDSVGIALFSADGKTTFPSVKAWQMSPIKIAPLEK